MKREATGSPDSQTAKSIHPTTQIKSRFPAENRFVQVWGEQSHRPFFGCPHPPFFNRFKVIVAGEVKPTMHDVEGGFGGEIVVVFKKDFKIKPEVEE